jgi:hypothetical protein
MKKRKQVVWVVMHYEYVGSADKPWPDALQFHVSSTRAGAERYIRSVTVESHSWWQIHPHELDALVGDEGDEVYFYSHRGFRLKAAPHVRAKAALQKLAARYPGQYPRAARKA